MQQQLIEVMKWRRNHRLTLPLVGEHTFCCHELTPNQHRMACQNSIPFYTQEQCFKPNLRRNGIYRINSIEQLMWMYRITHHLYFS